MTVAATDIGIAPYRLGDTIYGVLLNHRSALNALGDAVNAAPYNAPPHAPVLYVKPRNTINTDGGEVVIPAEYSELEAAACLGIVIGRAASRLTAANALDHVAGYVIVNDVSVPHATYYRPSIRFKARDGFCPRGAFAPRQAVPNPDNLTLRTFVDDVLVQQTSMADLIRPIVQLLVDVTEFMTLAPGDVLATGAAAPAPRVRAGQRVRIHADGLGSLHNTFVARVS